MSKEVKIFVGERQLDLYDGVAIPLNFNISDISEINKRAGSFSRTIKIPATQNNDIIMGFANNLKSRFRKPGEALEAGALTQIIKETARVEANGLTIFTGFIKPLGATLNKDGCYSEYSVNIFADNNDWVSVSKDKSLRDLDCSLFDHTYTKANIDSFEASGVSSDVLYPLINFGRFKGGGTTVTVEDRIPALKIKTLINQIFQEQNYIIQSSFLNSSFFDRLYMPLNSKFELTDDFVETQKFKAVKASNTESASAGANGEIDVYDSESFGNVNFNLATGEFTAAEPVKMKFILEIDDIQITSALKTPAQRFELRISTSASFFPLAAVPIVPEVDGTQNVRLETGVVDVAAGDKISVTLFHDIFSGADFQFTNVVFRNEVSKDIIEDADLDVCSLLPDITQLEFIQSLTHLFNLYFYADTNLRHIFIEPRDDFYFDSINALDWSDKVDNNKSCDIKYLGDNLQKNLRYRYKEDGKDEYVDFWEFENNTILGSHTEVLANNFTSGVGDKINNLFAPTFMDIDPDIGLNSTQIPKMWNDIPDDGVKANFSTDFDFRILYFDDVQATGGTDSWDWDGTIRTDYPRFYSVNDEDAPSENLNSLYFNDTNNSPGLFKKHYRNTHEIINFGKKVILHLNLTDVDIINFDFRQIVYIDGCYYYVETIKDYDTTVKQTTKVELLTLVDFKPLEASSITSRINPSVPLRAGFRRGNVRLRGDTDGNIIGGTDIDTGGFERNLLLGKRISATADDQVVIGVAEVLSSDVVDDSPLIITGRVTDCNSGELESKPLIQFDRDGNLIVGGGEIYTSCGNVVLYNNDVCNLQPVQKENINS